MLEFFYILGLEFLYSNFFHISLATPSEKKKAKGEKKTQQSKKVKDVFKFCLKENG